MSFNIYLALVFVAALAGGLIPLKYGGSKKILSLAVSFAGGVLVGTALFHLLPESIKILGGATGVPILLGFALFYIPQKFVLIHPCEEEDCDFHTLGVLAYVGITFHALIDGVGVGAASEVPEIGTMITTAVMVHKFPASLALSFLLIVAGMKRGTIGVMALFFAFATPVGAVITKGFLGHAEVSWLGYAMGLSTGNFLAIAGSDLLRRMHDPKHTDRAMRLAFLFLGLGVSLLGSG